MRHNQHRLLAALVTAAILAINSCVHTKPPSFEDLAAGLKVTKFQGQKHHLLILSDEKPTKNSKNVNIYLEGDGRPWINGREISKDPSPGYPLALHLMTLDPGPAFYITRPCYHLMSEQPCPSSLWTSARYSQEVVNAMAEGIRGILRTSQETAREQSITLIGYSGGGTLALLLARELEGIDRVVTVAGNLDTEAWTSLHNYTPLEGSMNPASLTLPGDIQYLHFAGEKDTNIPPMLGSKVYMQPGHEFIVLDEFDHRCCWYESWTTILNRISE